MEEPALSEVERDPRISLLLLQLSLLINSSEQEKCHPERSVAESKDLPLFLLLQSFFVHRLPKSVILSGA